MPYGDLAAQRLQRFARRSDLDGAECTAEEREEYEPHIAAGNVVYAGVDYAAIVERAQQEADLVVWDGGNNDFPFLKPDLHLVLIDALRPDQATGYHPGETNLRLADVIVVNKVDAASNAAVQEAIDNATAINPRATVVRAASPATADDPERLRDRRVLVVEDGPTITHGGMPYGAGYVAATAAGATIVDPRPSASGPIARGLPALPTHRAGPARARLRERTTGCAAGLHQRLRRRNRRRSDAD